MCTCQNKANRFRRKLIHIGEIQAWNIKAFRTIIHKILFCLLPVKEFHLQFSMNGDQHLVSIPQCMATSISRNMVQIEYPFNLKWNILCALDCCKKSTRIFNSF